MTQVAQVAGAAAEPAVSREAWQPTIVALICNWCTYAGADMAGTTRRTYPATVRNVRAPCTGRIDFLAILKAFEQGADAVLVSGCHPGDCHYVQGNYVARRRFAAFRSLMTFLGLDPRRLQFSWVSASEGVKWSQVVEDVSAVVREAGPLTDWGRVPAARPAVALPAAPPPPREKPAEAEQHAVAQHLHGLAMKLLDEKKVAAVVGYAKGPLPGQMVPAFVTRPEDAETLDWNERCANDLSVYIPRAWRQWGKIAVTVKRCDGAAAVGLLRENQIPREDLTLIGVSCPGIWLDGAMALKCYACHGEAAAIVDWTVSPRGAEQGAVDSRAGRQVAADPRDEQVAHLDSLPPAERWAYWSDAFQRCLRCYACRAVCPLCYCQVCVAEKNAPQWVPTSIGTLGNTVWNITRAFHLAGRCGGCDECSRACPAGVRLDLLNHKLSLEIAVRFGAVNHDDPRVSPPLATFRPDDAQEFIR